MRSLFALSMRKCLMSLLYGRLTYCVLKGEYHGHNIGRGTG